MPAWHKTAEVIGEQLADRAGWHHTTVSRIETGQSTISLVDFDALPRCLLVINGLLQTTDFARALISREK